MVEELMGAYGGRFIIAVLGVALGLACLIAVLWMLRGRSGPSPFVRGGKNRQPRLQVLDAAAVDTRRRLVLVRRDDVEHLVMIGGPTDIVIESGIAPATVSREAPSPAAEPSPLVARPPVPPRIPAPESRPPVEERRPVPVARPAVPDAEASPRPRQEPVLQVLPAATVPVQAPPAPAMAEPPSPARPVAAAGAAENALDAARGRVLGTAPEPARAAVTALPQQAEQPKVLGSDFERILEEEMASNLAAREGASGATPATPARNPAVPPVTGAIPEPNLQAEVARIFGEMSVTRDK
jgi:hypothetical protein